VSFSKFSHKLQLPLTNLQSELPKAYKITETSTPERITESLIQCEFFKIFSQITITQLDAQQQPNQQSRATTILTAHYYQMKSTQT